MHHPTDRITHTMAFVTPVVEHWLEREIAQWVHPMKVLFISATRAISFYHVTSINANNSNVVFTFVIFILFFVGIVGIIKKNYVVGFLCCCFVCVVFLCFCLCGFLVVFVCTFFLFFLRGDGVRQSI